MSKLTTPELLQQISNNISKATTKEDIYEIVKETLKDNRDFVTNASENCNFHKQYFVYNVRNNASDSNEDSKIWTGLIYEEHDALMGTVFSLFDSKPFIVRGYPKILYTEDAGLFNKEILAESKLDGTNLGIYTLPNGMSVVKTRNTAVAGFFGGTDFTALLKETGLYDSITSLSRKNNICIFGELYGNKNEGQFVRYDVPITFEVFDIVDMKTFSFMPRHKVEDYCLRYALPIVNIEWKGVIRKSTYKSLTKILELRSDVEGLVAKHDTYNDRIFGKIKCDKIKEICVTMTRKAIPKNMIGKAIKKALDNGISYEDALQFVKQELLEESDESLVNKSENRIKNLIDIVYKNTGLYPDASSEDNSFAILVDSIVPMIKDGKTKEEILSLLASRKGTDNKKTQPAMLYQAYCLALNKVQRENNS